MKRDTRGAINALLIPLIVISLLLVGVGVFAFWAFSGRQDYKNNVDQKITAAVKVAKSQQSAADAKQYAEQAKKPLRTYVGPADYGSIHIMYPKTWSAYIDDSGNGGGVLDGYFQPDFVPSVNTQSNIFALRLQVLQQSYDQVASGFQSQAQQNQVTVKAYKLAKVPSVVGIIVSGQIEPNKQGTMVVLPLRAYTLELWTESAQYQHDFNTYILPNFSFSP